MAFVFNTVTFLKIFDIVFKGDRVSLSVLKVDMNLIKLHLSNIFWNHFWPGIKNDCSQHADNC
jgi:hypothetical protein